MAIQSAVACSEAKDDGLLVSRQLMERVLVWVVSFSLAVEDGFLFIMDKSFLGVSDSPHYAEAIEVCPHMLHSELYSLVLGFV